MPSQLFNYSGNGSALTQRQWDNLAHVETVDNLYFRQKGLIGEDKGDEMDLTGVYTNFPVVHKHDLERGRGDKIWMLQVRQLTGSGFTGTTTAEGSEETPAFYNLPVTVEFQRNAVAYTLPMSQQRVGLSLKPTSIKLLSTWMAKKIDDAIFQSLYWGYPTWLADLLSISQTIHPNVRYAGGVSDWANVTAACVITLDTLEDLRGWAAENNINPVMIDGSPHWILVVHPRQLTRLRKTEMWRTAVITAQARGETNPIFRNAAGVYGGIVVHEHNSIAVPRTTEDATDDRTNKRMAILLGANAAVFATGNTQGVGRATSSESPAAVTISERSGTDYGSIAGWAMSAVYGARRTDWISDDGNSTVDNQSSALLVSWAPAL